MGYLSLYRDIWEYCVHQFVTDIQHDVPIALSRYSIFYGSEENVIYFHGKVEATG